MDPYRESIQPIEPPIPKQFDSQRYVASLEAKLNRMKQHNKEPNAKDVLHSLTEAKTAVLSSLIDSSQGPYLSNYSTNEDTPIDNTSLTATLQRRLQPEKQALSTEELEQLLENDELSKMSVEAQVQEENESNARIDHDESKPAITNTHNCKVQEQLNTYES